MYIKIWSNFFHRLHIHKKTPKKNIKEDIARPQKLPNIVMFIYHHF